MSLPLALLASVRMTQKIRLQRSPDCLCQRLQRRHQFGKAARFELLRSIGQRAAGSGCTSINSPSAPAAIDAIAIGATSDQIPVP